MIYIYIVAIATTVDSKNTIKEVLIVRQISREELRNKLILRESLTLVEALPEKYWRDSHLPGAIQMDYTEVAEKAHTSCLIKKRR